MTRSRSFLFTATTLLLLLLAITARGDGENEPETGAVQPVTLLIATDLHYLSPQLTDHGDYFQRMIRNGDGKAMEYCEELTDAFVSQVIAQRPDVLLLSGDLTFNGAKLSHTGLAQKLRTIQEAGIPVLVLPGNHDLQNAMAASFQGDGYAFVESIDADQFAQIYQPFGFETALSRDEASLSYIAGLTPTLRVLMLDVNTTDSPGMLKAETLEWAESQLALAAQQGARVLAVSHQNLLQHSSMFSYGFVIANNDALLAMYERYGVLCNLSGHIHLQHIAISKNRLPEIATSSLMVSPNQYGMLTVEGSSVAYHTVPVEVMEDRDGAPAFSDYAKAFFWQTAALQVAQLAAGSPDAAQLTDYYADVSAAFFSGRMDTVTWDDALLEEWKEQSPFIYSYLKRLRDDGPKNHTQFSYSFE